MVTSLDMNDAPVCAFGSLSTRPDGGNRQGELTNPNYPVESTLTRPGPMSKCASTTPAQVAELVDALASGASVRMDVEVRVLSWAPFPSHLPTKRRFPTATDRRPAAIG